MKLGFRLEASMTLFHKQTMKELNVKQIIEKEYDDNSQEFESLVTMYNDVIGFERKMDEKEYDKQLVILLSEDAKKNIKESIQTIEEVIKTCYYKDVPAYVEFAGYIINPKDFCAVKVNGIDFHATKTV